MLTRVTEADFENIFLQMIEQIQRSISGDAHKVQAYAWKEEHALPPAPKM